MYPERVGGEAMQNVLSPFAEHGVFAELAGLEMKFLPFLLVVENQAQGLARPASRR